MSKMLISILAAALVVAGTIGAFVATRNAHSPGRSVAAKVAAPPSPAWLSKHAVKLPKAAASTRAESGGEGPIDWNRPFVDDEPVADVPAASARLRFRPAAPAAIGWPSSVVVHRSFRPQAVGL